MPRPFAAACCAAACLLSLPSLPVGAAGLGYLETLELARLAAPSLRASQASLAGARTARTGADSLPDPRLAVGVENLPIAGADRFALTRDGMTMQRIALMQDMPSRARRSARVQLADARIERERAQLAMTVAAVRRDAALAWVGAWHAERRAALLGELLRENRLLQDTLPARIASGRAMPADLTMARQDALMLADRGDELTREVKRWRAELRRWVGARGDEALDGAPTLPANPDPGDVDRHADLAAYDAMRGMALAEVAEADAEGRGDWALEVAYSRRPRYDDMVSVQVSVELPWQRERRQQPQVQAKRRDVERLDAERDDQRRRRVAELQQMQAELDAVQAQLARLQGPGQSLAAERVALTLAAYEAGRADLAPVLQARAQALDLRLRAVDLESQRDALRVRLTTFTAE